MCIGLRVSKSIRSQSEPGSRNAEQPPKLIVAGAAFDPVGYALEVGFEMLDRAIARHGYEAFVDGRAAGVVTSGTQTPYLKKAIGMVYLPASHAAAGSEFEIDVRSVSVERAV